MFQLNNSASARHVLLAQRCLQSETMLNFFAEIMISLCGSSHAVNQASTNPIVSKFIDKDFAD